jgi:hypothetical protein
MTNNTQHARVAHDTRHTEHARVVENCVMGGRELVVWSAERTGAGGENGEAAVSRGRAEEGVVVRVLELGHGQRVRVDLVALLPRVRLPHDDSALLRLRSLIDQTNHHRVRSISNTRTRHTHDTHDTHKRAHTLHAEAMCLPERLEARQTRLSPWP